MAHALRNGSRSVDFIFALLTGFNVDICNVMTAEELAHWLEAMGTSNQEARETAMLMCGGHDYPFEDLVGVWNTLLTQKTDTHASEAAMKQREEGIASVGRLQETLWCKVQLPLGKSTGRRLASKLGRDLHELQLLRVNQSDHRVHQSQLVVSDDVGPGVGAPRADSVASNSTGSSSTTSSAVSTVASSSKPIVAGRRPSQPDLRIPSATAVAATSLPFPSLLSAFGLQLTVSQTDVDDAREHVLGLVENAGLKVDTILDPEELEKWLRLLSVGDKLATPTATQLLNFGPTTLGQLVDVLAHALCQSDNGEEFLNDFVEAWKRERAERESSDIDTDSDTDNDTEEAKPDTTVATNKQRQTTPGGAPRASTAPSPSGSLGVQANPTANRSWDDLEALRGPVDTTQLRQWLSMMGDGPEVATSHASAMTSLGPLPVCELVEILNMLATDSSVEAEQRLNKLQQALSFERPAANPAEMASRLAFSWQQEGSSLSESALQRWLVLIGEHQAVATAHAKALTLSGPLPGTELLHVLTLLASDGNEEARRRFNMVQQAIQNRSMFRDDENDTALKLLSGVQLDSELGNDTLRSWLLGIGERDEDAIAHARDMTCTGPLHARELRQILEMIKADPSEQARRRFGQMQQAMERSFKQRSPDDDREISPFVPPAIGFPPTRDVLRPSRVSTASVDSCTDIYDEGVNEAAAKWVTQLLRLLGLDSEDEMGKSMLHRFLLMAGDDGMDADSGAKFMTADGSLPVRDLKDILVVLARSDLVEARNRVQGLQRAALRGGAPAVMASPASPVIKAERRRTSAYAHKVLKGAQKRRRRARRSARSSVSSNVSMASDMSDFQSPLLVPQEKLNRRLTHRMNRRLFLSTELYAVGEASGQLEEPGLDSLTSAERTGGLDPESSQKTLRERAKLGAEAREAATKAAATANAVSPHNPDPHSHTPKAEQDGVVYSLVRGLVGAMVGWADTLSAAELTQVLCLLGDSLADARASAAAVCDFRAPFPVRDLVAMLCCVQQRGVADARGCDIMSRLYAARSVLPSVGASSPLVGLRLLGVVGHSVRTAHRQAQRRPGDRSPLPTEPPRHPKHALRQKGHKIRPWQRPVKLSSLGVRHYCELQVPVAAVPVVAGIWRSWWVKACQAQDGFQTTRLLLHGEGRLLLETIWDSRSSIAVALAQSAVLDCLGTLRLLPGAQLELQPVHT